MRLFIETNDIQKVKTSLVALEKEVNNKQREFTNSVGDYSYLAMRGNIPKYSSRTMERIRKGSIARKGPESIERTVGIKPDGTAESKLPLWLHYGTGVWGKVGRPYFNITPGPMTFYGYGRKKWISTYMVRGQQRSQYFDKTVTETEVFATMKARTLFNKL